MATWNIKANCKNMTIEIDDSATPSQVADLLSRHGLVDKSEMLGQIHLLPESDGSLTLVDDSGFPYAELRKVQEQTLGDIAAAATQSACNLPKCPTCGSTNLDKINAFDRGVAGGLFGFASKTARSQFRCKKCGYMW